MVLINRGGRESDLVLTYFFLIFLVFPLILPFFRETTIERLTVAKANCPPLHHGMWAPGCEPQTTTSPSLELPFGWHALLLHQVPQLLHIIYSIKYRMIV